MDRIKADKTFHVDQQLKLGDAVKLKKISRNGLIDLHYIFSSRGLNDVTERNSKYFKNRY